MKILKFKNISQSSEQVIRVFSEWRELDGKRTREFRNELAMFKTPLGKKPVFI